MNTDNIATDLFYKIRSRFSGLKLGAATGEITILPEEARFFDFDYMEGETPIGHVSVSLAEKNSMKIYFSHGITEAMDAGQKDNWYGFLKELRIFAKRRLLSFDTRDIAKDNLDKRDYNFLSKNSMDNEIGESVMKESSMYGTNKTSYQKLLDTRLIIKHNKTLQDDQVPGARSRNISALFVENQDGERFKYPFVHLAGARAMQRHVANGGLPYDEIGNSVVQMSEEIAQLKSFSNYVVRNDLMNSDTNGIVERSTSALTELRKKLNNISKQKHYAAYKENFQAQQAIAIPEDVVKEYTEKFTVRNFKDSIAETFPVIYRLMQAEAPLAETDLGYNDIKAMTESRETEEFRSAVADFEQALFDNGVYAEISDEAMNQAYYEFKDGDVHEAASTIAAEFIEQNGGDAYIVDEFEEFVDELSSMIHQQHELEYESTGPMAEFENWVDELGEADVSSTDFAVKKLQSLFDEYFPVGVDGINAIESIKEIIADDTLLTQFKETAQQDAEADARPIIKQWIQENNPETLDMFDFSDSDTETEGSEGQDAPQQINVQEVAEFIHSFYDTQSQTFPKGPEGVCTMVGKKFGEQAEQAARTMTERMAPHQALTDDATQQVSEISWADYPDGPDYMKQAEEVMNEYIVYLEKQGLSADGVDTDEIMRLLNDEATVEAAEELVGSCTNQQGTPAYDLRDFDASGYVEELVSEFEDALGIANRDNEDIDRLKSLSGIENEASGSPHFVAFNGKQIDVTTIEVGGVNPRDYPDFSDSYVEAAMYTDGTELSDEELAAFQEEYADMVYEIVASSLH